jgi:hypothetical protein
MIHAIGKFVHIWYAKEYVHAIEQSNQKVDNVIQLDRNDVKFVKFLFIGKISGVLVVDIG